MLKKIHESAWRKGFSLVELFVATAIIALLLALAAPAIQYSRESARRLECQNRLKQISLAWHNHHSTYGRFPSGGWGAQWVGDPDRGTGAEQPGGWAFSILPALGQPLMWELARGLTGPAKRAAATECVTSPVIEYYCPTRRAASNTVSWQGYGHSPPYNCDDTPMIAKIDFAANVGAAEEIAFAYPETLAEGDGNFAWSSTANFRGVAFQRSEVRFADLSDGTSNIFLVGEKSLPLEAYTGPASNGDHHGAYAGAVVDSLRSGHATMPPTRDQSQLDLFRRFGSAHAGSLHMAMADGRVRKLSYEIDAALYARYADRDDGASTGE